MNIIVQIMNKFLKLAGRSQHNGIVGIGKPISRIFSGGFISNTSFMLSICLHLIGISIIGLSPSKMTGSNSSTMQVDVFSMPAPKPVITTPRVKQRAPKLVVPQPARIHRQQLQTTRPIAPVITTETPAVTTLAHTTTLNPSFTLNAPQNTLAEIEHPQPVSVGKKPIFTAPVNLSPQRTQRISGLPGPDTDNLQAAAVPLNVPTISEPTQDACFLKKVEPIYPESARSTHQEGLVVLEATIGKDGKAQDIRVVEVLNISGLGCEEAAIQALKASVFTPAMNGKVVVNQRLRIPYRFNLKS